MDFALAPLSEKEKQAATALGMSENEINSLRGLAERIGITTVSTSYSGIDAPGTSILMMSAALEHVFGIKGQHPEHLWGVEWDSACRTELQSHPCRCSCLFGDIADFLSPALKSQMKNLQALDKLVSVFLPLVRDNLTKAIRLLLDVHYCVCITLSFVMCIFEVG